MSQAVIIYWSGTGNTESMAEAMLESAKNVGTEVELLEVSDASVDHVKNAEYVALGCPSMGDEVLEEDDMEPFVASLEGLVAGKKLLLFGSYGWGDGQWMRDWEERMKGYGATLVDEGLIVNEEPDADGLALCKEKAALWLSK